MYLHFYDFLPLKKVAMVVMLLFMPDSPKYLIAESKTPEARKALQWFRGPQFDVDEELRFGSSDVFTNLEFRIYEIF